jgi:hypothetical protein
MSDVRTPRDPAALYLDLMKKTLSYTLWEEPGVPIETFNYRRPPLRRAAFAATSWLLRRLDMQLLRNVHYTQSQRAKGAVMPMHAHTMIGLARLDNLQFCIEDALANGVPGDLIETGVWRGGACILMRAVLAAHGITDRRVFVADSFAGLPPPTSPPTRRTREIAITSSASSTSRGGRWRRTSGSTACSIRKSCSSRDGSRTRSEGADRCAVCHAPRRRHVPVDDGGPRESIPALSPGGYCIIDDYDIPRCREAVEDYRSDQRIGSPVQAIDQSGVFWQKRD